MPSSHSDRCRSALCDIRENALLCLDFIGGMDFTSFAEDKKTCYAAIRCLEIISEAARKLDGELTSRHSAIPWQAMRSAGNVYRHDYDELSESLIWHTVRTGLPLLIKVCDEELEAG